MDGYRLLLASDVSDRDGLGLELYDPGGVLVAEVFRDDGDSGRRTFTTSGPVRVRAEVLGGFLTEAARRL